MEGKGGFFVRFVHVTTLTRGFTSTVNVTTAGHGHLFQSGRGWERQRLFLKLGTAAEP